MLPKVLAGGLFAALVSASMAGQAPTPLTTQSVTPDGVLASTVRYDDRDALRLIEPDNKRNAGMAIINGLTFGDGTIEVDVAGRRGPYAIPDDRGFIGVVFRLSADRKRWEDMYLRPDNGRADDQVRRNHSIQYSSYPDYPWPRMRKEFPEKYESYVDLVAGQWTHMKIVVAGASARLFVNGALQPNLVVHDLKHGTSEGGVALWIGAGTEGHFSNLRVTAAAAK
jgi:hypothetical protein